MSELSDREWIVLEALWKSKGSQLGALTADLRSQTGWSTNTVHTYLTRMAKKGLVAIDKDHAPISTKLR